MTITVGVDSYVSEADAATYTAAMGLTTLSNPEALLKQATVALDRIYGGRFIGVKVDTAQVRMWPRWVSSNAVSADYRRGDLAGAVFEIGYAVDSDGNFRNFGIVPQEIADATVELALMLDSGKDLYAQPDAAVSEKSTQMDVIKTSTKYVAGLQKNPCFKIDVILRPLLVNGQSVRLVRG